MTEEKKLTGYPSIDKPWLKYYSKEWSPDMVPCATVYRNIWENNKDYLDETALIFNGFRTSYRTMFSMVESIAKALKAMGIGEGDCVNMCVSYVPEAVCLLLACSKIGALANFINPLFTTEQKIARLEETDSKILIILDAMFDYMKEVLSGIHIESIVILPAVNSLPLLIQKLANMKSGKNTALETFKKTDSRYMSWKMFLKRGCSYIGETEVSYAKNRPVVMVYSSGTTGASKGIVLTNDGINATFTHYKYSDFQYKRTDIFLALIPIWFSTGNVLSLLNPLSHGFTIALEPVFSKETFAKDVLKYRPCMTVTATSLWQYLISCPEYENVDLSFFRYPITGGEKIPVETENQINDFLKKHRCQAPLLKGYGMCELGGVVTATSCIHTKAGSVGYPIMGVTVAAFDMQTNEELPIGERGEICALTPTRMIGYYKNPTATDEFFYTDTNGLTWGCTGDIGYVDEDGDVFILGRASDSYLTEGGKRIYMFDIESMILENSAVDSCKVVPAVIGGKNTLAAHLVLKIGASANPQELLKPLDRLLRERLTPDSVPQYYKIRDSFPIHPNGKRDVETLKQEQDGFITVK